MIISFKYKFIFVKTYKTAGSSIETYLYNFLNDKDIIAQTKDYKGINCWGDFNSENLIEYFGETFYKKIKHKMKFFAHMPIWLVEERLKSLSKKINYDIFNKFYKFAVIRNPFDLVVSDYYWRKKSKILKEKSFDNIIKELESNTLQGYSMLNLNKLMDKNLDNILCNKIIKYENLNEELSDVFKKLGIPFSGKLEIFKKQSNRDKDYKKFYDDSSKKLIEEIFWKEMETFNYKF